MQPSKNRTGRNNLSNGNLRQWHEQDINESKQKVLDENDKKKKEKVSELQMKHDEEMILSAATDRRWSKGRNRTAKNTQRSCIPLKPLPGLWSNNLHLIRGVLKCTEKQRNTEQPLKTSEAANNPYEIKRCYSVLYSLLIVDYFTRGCVMDWWLFITEIRNHFGILSGMMWPLWASGGVDGPLFVLPLCYITFQIIQSCCCFSNVSDYI